MNPADKNKNIGWNLVGTGLALLLLTVGFASAWQLAVEGWNGRVLKFFFIPVPLLFGVFGIVWIWNIWCAREDTPASSGTKREVPIVTIAVMSVMLVVLIGASLMTFILPLVRGIAVAHWSEIECKIDYCDLHGLRLDLRGTATYDVDVSYTYFAQGHEHQSNRYSFIQGIGYGRIIYQHVLDRYVAGTQAICYVNPNNPDDAVLERFPRELWIGLIPIVFALILAWAIYDTLRKTGVLKK